MAPHVTDCPRETEGGQPSAPPWEVADIFRLYGETYRRAHHVSPAQQRVMRDIETCRTAQLGGHAEHLTLFRLSHWLPGGQTHPEVVQGTTEFHHQIADALLPQADAVFHNAAALDTAVDVLNPEPPLVERLVGPLVLQGQLPTAGLLRRHQDRHLRERERQEAQILQQPTPGWERIRRGLRDAQIMGPAAAGLAQKEDDKEGIDQQDIFHRVVFFW